MLNFMLKFFNRDARIKKFRGIDDLYANADEAIADKAIRNLLAAGSRHSGKSVYPHGCKIDGVFEGDLEVAAGRGVVWVAKSGRIKGNLKASQVYVHGIVDGSIEADVIVLEGQGTITGQVICNFCVSRHVTVASMQAKILSHEMGAKLDHIGTGQGLLVVSGGR